MKSILNKGIHEVLKLTHRSVSVTDVEHETYLKRANEIQTEIKNWLGKTEHENVGLGQNCNSSWYLKATENKRASYPFDWLFTTPEIIQDMLSDNFEAFTNRNQLIPHGLDAGHKRYHEWLFGHRNPANSDSDFEFLKRCIERWNSLMQSQKPVAFVTVVLNEFEKRKRWRDGFSKDFSLPKNQTLTDFDSMMDKLQSINPNCKFLFIEQFTEQRFELSNLHQDERSLWIKFCSVDANTGVQYLNSVDDEIMKTIYGGLQQDQRAFGEGNRTFPKE
ncbi:MAG: papain-like cysteine peptidase [Flavobacteriales bacterium]|nr:papain-like cysteine peptidase [Flavobacteriales bacterium]